MKRLLSLALVLLVAGGAGYAADLTKIPRNIVKEPIYQTKNPRYCLCVFGKDALPRVWLVLDGDTLYVDRNGNGDLTEKDEKVTLSAFEKIGEGIQEGHRNTMAGSITTGPNTKLELMLMQVRFAKNAKPQIEEAEMLKFMGNPLDGIVTGVYVMDEATKNMLDPKAGNSKELAAPKEPVTMVAFADARGALEFSDHPDKAPIVHFGGPLQIQLTPMRKLIRGQESDLSVCIGTPGLGKGTFVTQGYGGVPNDAYPVVELEFPPKEPAAKPIKLQVVLKERC